MGVVVEEGEDAFVYRALRQGRGHHLAKVVVRHPVSLVKDLHFGGVVVVEGPDGHVGLGHDVPDRDLFKVLLRQQRDCRLEKLVFGLLRLKLAPGFDLGREIFHVRSPLPFLFPISRIIQEKRRTCKA